MNQHTNLEAEADLMERQRQLEMEMSGMGRDRFLKLLDEAKQDGHETSTPGAKYAMKVAIGPVAEAFRAYLENKERGHNRSKARTYLKKTTPEVAAFITAKVIFDSVTMRNPIMRTALAIGQALEDEDRFEAFAEATPGLFKVVSEEVTKRTSNKAWKRKVMVHAMGKTEALWKQWATSDKIHLGQQCIRHFIEATGMVEIVTVKLGRNDTLVYLEPTASCLELITERNRRCELLSPTFMPTVVPPKQWSAPHSGGYWFLPRPLPFIKTHNRDYLKELSNTPAMAGVYDAVNAMQETAWCVNRGVLAVMHEVWDRSLPLGGLEFKIAQPMPLCPACQGEVDTKRKDHACFETDKQAHTDWKRAASKVHTANGKARSKQLQVAKVLWVAEKFKAEVALYFPTQLDFRGRAYSVPMFLNPQGADWAKGLLTFAQGKPIADERAAGWLMIHGANTYGFDKVSLEDRVGWVEENEAAILACAEDPLGTRFWSDADKPWQFLAFCFEYAAFKEHGYGYVSTLPVALDGSCNGLQHFSAMLRDPIGGKAVNLLPSEKPNDIYQTVMDRVKAKMKADGGPMALAWLALNPDRKLTKRPVMTLPYGSTLFSCKEYVGDWLAEQEHSFGENTSEAENYCAKMIWDSIGEVVVAARQAMDWLQKSARGAAAEGKPVRWTTPDGLPVMQAYPDTDKHRIMTRLGDTIIYIQLRYENGKLDKRRQANGISPNFVHSMDAAALRLYVRLARDNGISSFALVHDSYGTLAADTDMSAACLREAFVNMYEGQNHLEALRTSLAASVNSPDKLPPVPPMGTLDLEQVRHADYFFA